ncbi:uncharacterized protein LOC135337661 isoform X2 [Halichondria panicea]|uniref:uncharacterized protein LOC135337661 isoform X1 n=1 Tax=Halichondria panicea TaxID=6063 RepID=UPI00312B9290
MTKAAHKDAESDDTLDDEPEDLYQPGEEDFDPNEDNLLAELHLATSGSNTPGVCTNLNELRESTQVVTEEEREHVMSGNFDQLLAEQERMDRERDNELRRREEALSGRRGLLCC